MSVARAETDLERLTTGIEALDGVLAGGIPRGSTVFVSGLPGAGKTIVAEQMLFANANRGTRCLYVTTLSEPAIKILRFASRFSFFKPHLLEQYIHFADAGTALNSGGAAALLGRIEALIRELRPEFLVIDSFKVVREFFDDTRDFRRFTSELLVLLGAWEITALLVGEYTMDDVEREPEFAIADGIIHLFGTGEQRRQKRYLNIMKMRGTPAYRGAHFFQIGDDGIELYPRMLAAVTADYGFSEERLAPSIPGLAEMLGGGVLEGSVALLNGGSGSGKTLVALSFAAATVARGDRCLFVTFEESPHQLLRHAAAFGWELEDGDGAVEIMHVAPSELDLERHSVAIRARAEEMNARLVVIDSITAFEMSLERGEAFREYVWGIADHFRRNGITLVMTLERHAADSPRYAFEPYVSYVADTVILLRLVEDGRELRRDINVLKSRGSAHSKTIQRLRIERNSICIEGEGGQEALK